MEDLVGRSVWGPVCSTPSHSRVRLFTGSYQVSLLSPDVGVGVLVPSQISPTGDTGISGDCKKPILLFSRTLRRDLRDRNDVPTRRFPVHVLGTTTSGERDEGPDRGGGLRPAGTRSMMSRERVRTHTRAPGTGPP